MPVIAVPTTTAKAPPIEGLTSRCRRGDAPFTNTGHVELTNQVTQQLKARWFTGLRVWSVAIEGGAQHLDPPPQLLPAPKPACQYQP